MFENVFLHDEKIFFVQFFFCVLICTSSNPQDHLEHARCAQGDSKQRPVGQQLETRCALASVVLADGNRVGRGGGRCPVDIFITYSLTMTVTNL